MCFYEKIILVHTKVNLILHHHYYYVNMQSLPLLTSLLHHYYKHYHNVLLSLTRATTINICIIFSCVYCKCIIFACHLTAELHVKSENECESIIYKHKTEVDSLIGINWSPEVKANICRYCF